MPREHCIITLAAAWKTMRAVANGVGKSSSEAPNGQIMIKNPLHVQAQRFLLALAFGSFGGA